VVCINWGPWDGGMVTPALRQVFEKEGIGLIAPGHGAQFLLAELAATDRAAEVVAGVWKSGVPTAESNSLTDLAAAVVPVVPAVEPANSTAGLNLVTERELELTSHPVLESHILGGRAVLPMALHVEWLAHAAMHGNPGLALYEMNELRILHGVQLEAGQTVPLRILAGKATRKNASFVVPVELRSCRENGREVIHSRGNVVLASSLAADSSYLMPGSPAHYSQSLSEIYRSILFHGPALHGIKRIISMSEEAVEALVSTAPAPAEWIARPLRPTWLADPMVLDCAFQLLAVWSVEFCGMPCLPCYLNQYRQFRKTFPQSQVQIRIRVRGQTGQLIHADVEFLDSQQQLIARIERGEFVRDPALTAAFRNNRLSTASV